MDILLLCIYNNNCFNVHQITYKGNTNIEGAIGGFIAQRQSLACNHGMEMQTWKV